MSRKNLSTKNISDQAANELEYVIRDSRKDVPVEATVTVDEALAERPVFQMQQTRDVTRVLFISTDTSLLDPSRQTLDGYVQVSDLFEEVHIVVLRIGIAPKDPVLRASENVWIYTASAKHWWELSKAGFALIEDQLSFASGFRPDLIVARDPIESALVALKTAEKFGRPTQLHVVEDIWTKDYARGDCGKWFRRFLTRFTIPRFTSVRVSTDIIVAKLAQKYTVPDLKVLPRLQNYEALIDKKSSVRLSERFHNFSVFLLCIGDITTGSDIFRVVDAVQYILHNERIGLIIVGEGAGKSSLEQKIKTLGIEKQVIFRKSSEDTLPYLKGAHMLIVPDSTAKSEEIVLQGAAAGIPLILSETEKRKDIFVDKVSAYFINANSIDSISTAISDILNDVEGRQIMAKNAQLNIKQKFHFDPMQYQSAYRNSIEEALLFDKVSPEDEA